ncbi:olfactory receptor 6M1-like [Microcaecilia unicolor]|uniref:Olfactory receptor n=1 Tax=Microcaecilia unicolor TaxID=1415580 RepID=A0A6P7WW17_9AMPH|nr:olfactory receptor 6M1-like [Microcaecilia unicolor]
MKAKKFKADKDFKKRNPSIACFLVQPKSISFLSSKARGAIGQSKIIYAEYRKNLSTARNVSHYILEPTLDKGNQTKVNNFILLGFSTVWQTHILLFLLLLILYSITLMGNIIIILLILKDHRLQTPMYFFLINLSFLEIAFTTVTVPNALQNLVTGNKIISFSMCIAQCYFYFFLGSTELLLLMVMSIDRYTAICYPLRYTTIMNHRFCLFLAIGSWVGGFLDTILQTILVSRLPFCGPNIIDHFFCDIGPLLKLACKKTELIQLIDLIMALTVVLSSLVLTTLSYIYITSTILRIRSSQGRWKAFNTCTSHITVVMIIYGSSLFSCFQPSSKSSVNLNKITAVLTTIITPLLNPFIYSLRNEKVKEAFLESITSRKSIR